MSNLSKKFLQAWNLNSKILHLGLIAGAALVVWGATCGLWSLSGADEARYTLIAKELLDNGNVFLLTVNGAPYDQKPPLVFWLFAVALKACGGETISFAPRIVAVIFALITLCCTYLCGRKLLNARAGLYSAFILATFPIFMNQAVKARLDMIFTAFIAIAITAIITREPDKPVSWLRAFGIWAGLTGAFLAKGPLALLIVLVFIILYAASNGKNWWRVMCQLRFGYGLIFVLAVIAIWLAIEIHLVGLSFVTNQIGGETVERVMQGDHKNPVWYYFAHIFETIGIWLFVLLTTIYMLIRRKLNRMPQLKIWLFWFLPGFILLTLASGKRVTYLLPLLPPLALFIGFYVDQLAQGTSLGKIVKILHLTVKILSLAIGSAICLASTFFFFNLALAWTNGFYLSRLSLLCAFISSLLFIGAGLWRLKPSPKFGWLCGMVIFMALLANFFINSVIYPARDVHNTSRYFSQNLTRIYPELLHAPLGVITGSSDGSAVYNTGIPRFHVYGQYKITPVTYSQNMFANQTESLPDFILIRGRDLHMMEMPVEDIGFYPAFWDTIEGRYEMVLLRRAPENDTGTLQYKTSPPPLLLAADENLNVGIAEINHGESMLGPGLLLLEGVPRPYRSTAKTAQLGAMDIYAVYQDFVRIYNLDMRQGFAGNPYGVNWLMKNGRDFEARYRLLVLAGMPLDVKTGPPYDQFFNLALLEKIIRKNYIEAVFFTGEDFDVAKLADWLGMAEPEAVSRKITGLWLDFASHPAAFEAVLDDATTARYPLGDAL